MNGATRRAVCAMLLCLSGGAWRAGAVELFVSGYTYGVAPNGSYPDSGGELTNREAVVTVWPGIAEQAKLVGWSNNDMDVTFGFAAPVTLNRVVVYLADSDGTSGVGLPTSVTLSTTGGFSRTFPVVNPPTTGKTMPITLADFEVTTDNVRLTAARAYQWTMASEVLFYQDMPYRDTVMKDNPYVYWTFDEDSGNAVDAVRSVSLAPQGNATRVAHADYGNAADFDGAAGTRFYNGGTGLTVIPSQLWAAEMWLQVQGPLDGSRSDYILENRYSVNNNPGVIFDYAASGDNKLELFGGGGRSGASGPSVADTEWHHVVLAFYGNTGGFGIRNRHDIWIDGVLTEITDTAFSAEFGLQVMALGATHIDGSAAFQGRADEYAVYDIGSGLGVAATDASAEQRFEDRVRAIVTHPRAAQLAECERAAASYAYTGALQPHPNYADPGNAKLKDGIVGSNIYNDNTWMGVQNSPDNGLPQPQIDFDLGSPVTVDAVKIDYLVDQTSGIRAPDRVVFSFSTDGVTFGGEIEAWGFDDSADPPGGANGALRAYLVDIPNLQTRYVRATLYSNAEWVFLGEVRFATLPATGTLFIIR